MYKYSNNFMCNCGKILPVEKAKTCLTCGAMLCGDCGKFCKYHNLENEKLIIFAFEGEIIHSTVKEFSELGVHFYCVDKGLKVKEILEFEGFVYVEVN